MILKSPRAICISVYITSFVVLQVSLFAISDTNGSRKCLRVPTTAPWKNSAKEMHKARITSYGAHPRCSPPFDTPFSRIYRLVLHNMSVRTHCQIATLRLTITRICARKTSMCNKRKTKKKRNKKLSVMLIMLFLNIITVKFDIL
ncbi:hypothetical protein PUN28_010589 [Cardiocondyla obscurior]|uniref:Secreted protein n=1 Tax=Cardiocondyla obscurior TaxID=286306 RepID=A0AAW2FK07_9HYME